MLFNNHPSLDMIMDFVCLSKDTQDKKNFADYFELVSHFAKCTECRRIKDEMMIFNRHMDSLLASNEKYRAFMLKVYRSLERLDVAAEWNDKDILLSVKGKVSKNTGESIIKSVNIKNKTELISATDRELVDSMSEFVDTNNNRISLGTEKVEVSLNDDGRERHSLLLIPDNIERNPMICALEKEDNRWQASCSCPEDEYDIVVF